MTRPSLATAVLLALSGSPVSAAGARAAQDAEPVRVAIVPAAGSGWRARGLARATLAHLARADGLLPANPAFARRLIPAGADAPPDAVAAAARVLRAHRVAVVACDPEQGAAAGLLDAAKAAWTQVRVEGPAHELPGKLAVALAEGMGMRLSPGERERIAKPLVASDAAMEALWQGDAQDAPVEQLRHYRRAVREDASSAAAHNQLGAAQARRGRLREAIAELDRAIELQPDSTAAHTNRGLVLKQQGRWEEAEKALRRAVELGTKSPAPHVALARLLDRRGAARQAVEQLERAVEFDPSHLGALMTLADVAFAQQHFKDARRRIERILELEPDSVPALNLLGLLEMVPRRYEASEKAFRKALGVESESATTLANLGLALYGQKRVTDAVAAVEQAIARDRRNGTAHFYLGRIYLQEKRYGEAVAALERAVEFAPHMLPARQALAEARARSGTRAGGCGCAPFAGGPGSLVDAGLGSVLPVALLLVPHAVRLGLRRRRRRRGRADVG